MLTRRLPHRPHTSLAAQSGTVVSAPYRSAISPGSGLDLMLAIPTPDDQPDAGGGSVAERHRRAAVRLYLTD
jgi:hypothetical protein